MNILLKLFLSFFKLGAFSFGGGYATISLLEQEIKRNYPIISNQEIVDILAISEMTPGPVAVNSATFVGYRVAGLPGSIVATLSVILPSIIVMGILIYTLNKLEGSKYIDWFFQGVRPVIVGMIASAALSVAKGSIIDLKFIILSVTMFYLVGVKNLNGIYGIIIGAITGILLY